MREPECEVCGAGVNENCKSDCVCYTCREDACENCEHETMHHRETASGWFCEGADDCSCPKLQH